MPSSETSTIARLQRELDRVVTHWNDPELYWRRLNLAQLTVTPQSVTIRATNPDWYDEAYTYTTEQLMADEVSDRVSAWSNIISSPISGYSASFWVDEPASKTAWIVKWGKFWEMLGIAHEARVYNKEVELVDGELKIS